jgi:hypothetical protein
VTRPAPRAKGRSTLAILAAVLVVPAIAGGVLLVLAQTPRPAPTASAPASGVQGSLPAPATGTPEPSASVNPSQAAGAVVIDRTLLDLLPRTIGNAQLLENVDGETHDLTDPALADEASALVAALAIDPVTGDFAYVSVIRLRPGVFSDAYFESWRQTFDGGACSQAGGVAKSGSGVVIGTHLTFVDQCVGGILTHHVHLPGDIIVSISSLGDGHFGQLVVEGLR